MSIIDFNGQITVAEALNNVVHGDCLAVMRALPDKCIDVIITSPPYNLLNSTGNGLKKNTRTGKWVNAAIKEGYNQYNDNMPYDEYVSWQREKGAINFNPGYFLPTTEQIYMICQKPFKLAKGTNKFTDVWEIGQEMKNPHPAPFPEELIDRIIQSTTGQIVLDPFCGSGTTAVSAKKFGRDFIMIEQSQQYCELSLARINGEENWRDV